MGKFAIDDGSRTEVDGASSRPSFRVHVSRLGREENFFRLLAKAKESKTANEQNLAPWAELRPAPTIDIRLRSVRHEMRDYN